MLNRLGRITFLGFVVSALNGCSSDPASGSGDVIELTRTDPCAAGADHSRCLSDHYFAGFAKSALPACSLAPPMARLDGTLQLGLLAAASIGDEAVVQEARLLQGYYDRYGLAFSTHAPVRQVRMTTAIKGSKSDFESRLRAAGIDPEKSTATPEEIAKATDIARDLFYGDLRALVTALSKPVQPRIEVVVLSHVASKEFADLSGLPEGAIIAGLGLSPKVFREIAADEPDKNLFSAIGLPEDFTAVLFVGHDDIVRLAKSAEAIVAHELGHCMGLQHTKTAGNLMTQLSASNACRPELTDEQLATIREGVTPKSAPTHLAEEEDPHKREVLKRLAGAPGNLVARYWPNR